MGLLFYVSSLSVTELQDRGWALDLWDKLQHAVAYGVLAILWVVALHGGLPRRIPWKTALIAFLLASAYGAVDEIHQSFVPSRHMELGDWVADTVGAAIVFLWTLPRKPPSDPRRRTG